VVDTLQPADPIPAHEAAMQRAARRQVFRERAPPATGAKDVEQTVHQLAQVIHRRGPWRSFEAADLAAPKWADWFDHRQLLEPIGNIPPAEAEERYSSSLDQTKIAA